MQVIEHQRWTIGSHGMLAWAFDGAVLILADVSRVRRSILRSDRPALTKVEVACLCLATLSNAEVSKRLEINAHSAKRNFDRIMMKLGAASRSESIVIGLRRGLIGVNDLPMSSSEATSPATLSSRETAYARLAALPLKLAADRMGASEHVAKFHFVNLTKKLGVHSRAEAFVSMLRRGDLVLDDVVISGDRAEAARG